MPWLPPSLQGIPSTLQPIFKALTRQLRLTPKITGLPSGAGNHLVLAGTLPTGGFPAAPSELDIKLQCGYASGTTSATGRVTVTFQEAFPNGLISAVATRASAAGNAREIGIDTAAGQTDRTKVTFIICDSAGATQNTAAYLFTWIALGW